MSPATKLRGQDLKVTADVVAIQASCTVSLIEIGPVDAAECCLTIEDVWLKASKRPIRVQYLLQLYSK